MATVVVHSGTGKKYVLVGAGFGAFQSKKPNWLLGDLVADTTEGQHTMACVCDRNGDVRWVDSAFLTVVSVDGESPASILGD